MGHLLRFPPAKLEVYAEESYNQIVDNKSLVFEERNLYGEYTYVHT